VTTPGRDLNLRASGKFSQFAAAPIGAILLGAWAFLEPSFWFIAPDLFLWLLCLYSPKKFVNYFWITLACALAGASFYFALNLLFFDPLGPVLMATPFVHQGMFTRIEATLADHGPLGLLTQAFSFMSVKIWVRVAVEQGMPFWVFIPLTGISRALRFFIFAWIFRRIGLRFEGLLRRYFIPFVILFVLGFIGLLVFMETTVLG
jgi:membrane protein YqaA with SNARE-associated domain